MREQKSCRYDLVTLLGSTMFCYVLSSFDDGSGKLKGF
jgi:hypothetical protein